MLFFYAIVMTSLLGRTLTRWNAYLVCILMPILSDVARLVQLVVLVVSLFSSDLISCYFLPSMILPFLRFVPLVVVVVPFCVFSLSEMLNALLISSFYYWFQQFPGLFDWFQHFQFLFDWFQQFPVLFDWFYYYPVF